MHSKFGYSAVSTFEKCPYQYKLRYIDELETLPSDDPASPLIVGTALHRGIETDTETAINEYFMSYPVITDYHINEAIKLGAMIPKVKALIDTGNPLLHEVFIRDGQFMGTIDLLEELYRERDGTIHYALWDFKYSNNVESYLQSAQLHLYKYHYERISKNKIDTLGFIFVPKTMIRQKKTEDLCQFRKRLIMTLDGLAPFIEMVDYDPSKVEKHFELIEEIKHSKSFAKNETKLCDWCEYKDYCQKGIDYMILPSTDRRPIGTAKKRKIWIYGASFSGKTTMLDSAPNPLNLNTDGNIEFVTMPYVSIKDVVTVEGRVTKRKFAWELFKETIEELEKKDNDFKTIIIDLVEDTREMCRLYKYEQMGIEHESDSGYGKGWDIIKTEYLSVMRRFFNLDYENLVVVSHENVSEIKKKNGQTITKIAPNLQEAVALKIAGMVDMVARVVVEDDGARTLNFKSNEFIFGGGRLKGVAETTIPLDWGALMSVYDSAAGTDTPAPEKPRRESRRAAQKDIEPEQTEPTETEPTETEPEQPTEVKVEPTESEQPKRRTRRKREE